MKKFIKAICGSGGLNERRYGFFAVVLLLGMLGTFLRLYLIGDQILLDDEWHSFFCVTAHPLAELLGHSFVGANCAPVNAYCWIILHTVGWSEFWIRLPGLLSGILALFLFPFIVKKAHGQSVAVIFSIFMALSPFLTFYSRVARPYSELVFLLFTAIYAANFWLLSGKTRYQWIYILSAVTAVYFQPIAMVTIFAPLAAGGICSVFGKRLFKKFSVPVIRPSWMDIALTGGVVLAAAGMILSSTPIKNALTAQSVPGTETLKQFVLLLFGTSSPALAGGLLCFCLVGLIALFRKNLFWGLVFLLLLVAQILMFGAIGAECVDVALVLARYTIILFPISFVCTALGLNACFSLLDTIIKRRNLTLGKTAVGAAAIFLFTLLLSTNPLWDTYAAPNNFTNHSAFQESYDSFWRGGPTKYIDQQ